MMGATPINFGGFNQGAFQQLGFLQKKKGYHLKNAFWETTVKKEKGNLLSIFTRFS
jgi:hypothetical protein